MSKRIPSIVKEARSTIARMLDSNELAMSEPTVDSGTKEKRRGWEVPRARGHVSISISSMADAALGLITPTYTVRGEDAEADKKWDEYNSRELGHMKEVGARAVTMLLEAKGFGWESAHLAEEITYNRKAGCRCGCSPAWVMSEVLTSKLAQLYGRHAGDTQDVSVVIIDPAGEAFKKTGHKEYVTYEKKVAPVEPDMSFVDLMTR